MDGPCAPLRLVLPHALDAVGLARQAVVDHLAGDASARALNRIEVVLEEVLMNILRHGGVAASMHPIRLELSRCGDAVQLSFEDSGPAFDPTGAVRPSMPRDLADAVPGGLGLVLVRKFANGLRYERRDGSNRLTVVLALH